MYQNTLVLGSGSNFFHFNTSDGTGAPITLAGTPSLACRVNGGASATAGLTLSVDHGSITGLHRVAVDVDNVTLALADGDVVEVYIAAGTVDGVSAVGKLVAQLAITDGTLLTQTKADINAEADTALTDYNPPTRAELTSDINSLNDLDAAGVRAAVGLGAADLDTQLGAIDTVTAALTAAAAAKLALSTPGIVSGAVSGAGSTTTSVVTDLTEATDDHYAGRIIVFTSGALNGQASDISAYNGTSKALTVTALTEAPADTDTFVIV